MSEINHAPGPGIVRIRKRRRGFQPRMLSGQECRFYFAATGASELRHPLLMPFAQPPQAFGQAFLVAAVSDRRISCAGRGPSEIECDGQRAPLQKPGPIPVNSDRSRKIMRSAPRVAYCEACNLLRTAALKSAVVIFASDSEPAAAVILPTRATFRTAAPSLSVKISRPV